MSQQDFLARLIRHLEAAGIAYMVTGSLGSTFYGEPRTTQDIDVVISPTPEQLESFLQGLGEDYYVSSETAREALRQRTMFNIIDLNTSWKADLIVRKDRPFSVEEFGRRQQVTLLDVPLWTVSIEDVILSKLEWSQTSGSERQYQDAFGVAAGRWSSLDRDYLRHWARELGIEERLEQLLREAEQLQGEKPS